MDDKRRPSLFNADEFGKGFISLNLTENDFIALITTLQYACKMYSLTERVMREQGNDKEADSMKSSADMAMEMANRLIMDADPGYPGKLTDYM